MSRKRASKQDEPPRSAAMRDALRDVEALGKAVREDQNRESARKTRSRDRETLDKGRMRNVLREKDKGDPAVERMRSEKTVGGVRGKFHPSKKGSGKTVSTRSLRREAQRKRD